VDDRAVSPRPFTAATFFLLRSACGAGDDIAQAARPSMLPSCRAHRLSLPPSSRMRARSHRAPTASGTSPNVSAATFVRWLQGGDQFHDCARVRLPVCEDLQRCARCKSFLYRFARNHRAETCSLTALRILLRDHTKSARGELTIPRKGAAVVAARLVMTSHQEGIKQ